jgi:hypothetical protein
LKRVISETDNLLLKEIQLEYKIMDNQLGVSSGIIDELSNTCIIQNELAGKLLNLLAEEFGEFESLVEVGEWNLQEKNRRALSPEGEEVQKLCREQQSYDFKTFEMVYDKTNKTSSTNLCRRFVLWCGWTDTWPREGRYRCPSGRGHRSGL